MPLMPALAPDDDVVSCRVCGCTESDACIVPQSPFGVCWWVEPDLCSACVDETRQETTD